MIIEQIKNHETAKFLDRIVPLGDHIKVVYHKPIQKNPPRAEEIEFIIQTDTNAEKFLKKVVDRL